MGALIEKPFQLIERRRGASLDAVVLKEGPNF
jgi:hypothetical protein